MVVGQNILTQLWEMILNLFRSRRDDEEAPDPAEVEEPSAVVSFGSFAPQPIAEPPDAFVENRAPESKPEEAPEPAEVEEIPVVERSREPESKPEEPPVVERIREPPPQWPQAYPQPIPEWQPTPWAQKPLPKRDKFVEEFDFGNAPPEAPMSRQPDSSGWLPNASSPEPRQPLEETRSDRLVDSLAELQRSLDRIAENTERIMTQIEQGIDALRNVGTFGE